MIYFQKTSTGIRMTTDPTEADIWLHTSNETIWTEYEKVKK